ncbi:beta-N-acetylhexosaminidase [Galbibacter orientalis]|uniref:beta-N-acetylhexosaminidase n=1 Tax=Galbibacter orientalis TaxID=453852 RepID=UPI003080E710
MKNYIKIFSLTGKYMSTLGKTIFLFLFIFASCSKKPKLQTSIEDIGLIPIPVSVDSQPGTFEILESTPIYVNGDDELVKVANYFSETIHIISDFHLEIASSSEEIKSGVLFKISSEIKNEEGYKITASENLITLEAKDAEGAFRGVQTLLQLLSVQENAGGIRLGIPAVKIEDYPQYEYRGSMLDVSRHFFSVDEIKRYIDLMASYKLNVLHLHLTDDQGWRIEIKSWPKLTEIGGSTEVDGGDGGFYTQEQYKDIVNYAAARYITIIPEIDMPGHTNAALASYPELNCDGNAPELYTGTEVGFSSLCIDKEITYKFVEDVIKELVEITPGPYIHIGGDESHSTELEDYIPFVTRVQDMVYKYGKTPIGWDEIRHAKLKKASIVQFWANKENAKAAVKQGVKVLMSPSARSYMDMKYDSITPLGLQWAGLINVKKAYNWNPATLVDSISKKDIIGVEAPLWAETIETMEDIEYMTFPRLLGYAEISWSPDSLRNWETYKLRLAKQYKDLKLKNVNLYESKMVPWEKGIKDSLE